jgi:Methyltransferase domain
VADVGCGHGASTILMGQAFPNSTFVGSDYHEGSIATARQRAHEAGVADRVRFESAPAAAYSGAGYDARDRVRTFRQKPSTSMPTTAPLRLYFRCGSTDLMSGSARSW